MKNLKIFTKLFVSHAIVGLIAVGTLGAIVYFVVSNFLIQRTLDQLSSINILKKDLVENYLSNSQKNLHALQLEKIFVPFIQSIHSNQSVIDLSRGENAIAIDSLNKLYNFEDIYLLDAHNNLLIHAGHGRINHLLHKIDSITNNQQHMRMIDLTTRQGQPTLLYYYVPIIEDHQLLGKLLVLENMEKLQQILLENTGLGNTGESYLVGNNMTMRSASRFFPGKIPSSIVVRTEATNNASRGFSGEGIFEDYRNEKVLSVYRTISHGDLHWTIISEIDWKEAMQPIIKLRNYLLFVILVIILVTLVLTFFLSNVIALPILQLKEIIIALSKGINPLQKPAINSTDEIGLMAGAVVQLMEGLQRTATFANEIGAGNFKTSFTTLSDDDKLGQALLRMRNELQHFHEREIRSARERAAALIEGQEQERKRIINELHDGVGQLLTAIRMRVDMLEQESELKAEIKAQINETIAEVKRISYNVMPQALVDFGLQAALKGLCDNIRKYTAISIDFQYIKECEHTLNFEITIAVFRIVQEGLNNIVNHSGATQATLHVIDKEDEIYFVLEDNGKGFNEMQLQNTGSGLRNIRERATLINGKADINSLPGHGTTIEVHIPIPESN